MGPYLESILDTTRVEEDDKLAVEEDKLAVYVLLAVYLRYDSRRRNARFYTWCRHANFGTRLQPGSTPDYHQLLPSVGAASKCANESRSLKAGRQRGYESQVQNTI